MGRFSMSCLDIKNATVIPFQMPQIPGYGTSSNVNLVVEDPTDGDLSEFSKKTDNFLAKLMERKEVSMAMSTYSEKFPKFRVEVDPTQCSRAGLSAKEVLSTLGNYCSGQCAHCSWCEAWRPRGHVAASYQSPYLHHVWYHEGWCSIHPL